MFGKPKAGGFMDEIRCDEPSYLIWKWHPAGSEAGNNNRENAIRWGSSLRVKEGEAAVFVYNQPNGVLEDFIEGPAEMVLETENLPVLASIIGLAYEGGTPFQAEVYFINLAKVIQTPFAVPYFDIYDPRFLDFGVPTAVRGTLSFNIADYHEFIKLHRLATFDLDTFQKQIKDALTRYVKNIVANIPAEKNIPVVQLERQISTINDLVEKDVKERLEKDFGVNVTGIDIGVIDIDKSSEGYRQLKSVTQDLTAATVKAQTEVNIKDMKDMQRINAENTEETLRIQREEAQYAQRKQTQSSNFATYQVEAAENVGVEGARGLGQMGSSGAGGGGGLDPATMMAGMAVGGAVGQNIAGMMNNAMQGFNSNQQTQPQTPPPVPTVAFYVVQNGQSTGPFDIQTLSRMKAQGSFSPDSLVWKEGMADWAKAGDIQELQNLFSTGNAAVPPVPPIPSSNE